MELGVLPESIAVRHDGEVVARHARCYARNKDVVDPEHDKAMLQRGRRASVERLRGRFLALGDVAAAYYQGLKDTRLSPDTHVRKILALLDENGEEETLRAMADSAEFKAFSSDFVANIIHARRRFQEEPGPLHLSRRSDMLDIDIDTPDMDAYDITK